MDSGRAWEDGVVAGTGLCGELVAEGAWSALSDGVWCVEVDFFVLGLFCGGLLFSCFVSGRCFSCSFFLFIEVVVCCMMSLMALFCRTISQSAIWGPLVKATMAVKFGAVPTPPPAPQQGPQMFGVHGSQLLSGGGKGPQHFSGCGAAQQTWRPPHGGKFQGNSNGGGPPQQRPQHHGSQKQRDQNKSSASAANTNATSSSGRASHNLFQKDSRRGLNLMFDSFPSWSEEKVAAMKMTELPEHPIEMKWWAIKASDEDLVALAEYRRVRKRCRYMRTQIMNLEIEDDPVECQPLTEDSVLVPRAKLEEMASKARGVTTPTVAENKLLWSEADVTEPAAAGRVPAPFCPQPILSTPQQAPGSSIPGSSIPAAAAVPITMPDGRTMMLIQSPLHPNGILVEVPAAGGGGPCQPFTKFPPVPPLPVSHTGTSSELAASAAAREPDPQVAGAHTVAAGLLQPAREPDPSTCSAGPGGEWIDVAAGLQQPAREPEPVVAAREPVVAPPPVVAKVEMPTTIGWDMKHDKENMEAQANRSGNATGSGNDGKGPFVTNEEILVEASMANIARKVAWVEADILCSLTIAEVLNSICVKQPELNSHFLAMAARRSSRNDEVGGGAAGAMSKVSPTNKNLFSELSGAFAARKQHARSIIGPTAVSTLAAYKNSSRRQLKVYLQKLESDKGITRLQPYAGEVSESEG